ncbi:MAG: ABC transporter ATP-binding protein [Bacteroidia bacterium]|nr:ABC transporter ATP-binding protein [Bacteroidia bacterium]MCZ2247704.1 ATP-binding cassette domain-containing protein [Bacteroidia bacterium]
MIEIIATDIGKKFGTEWIIKNFNHHFTSDKPCVILGGNGSGKSTLLKIISAYMQAGKGKLEYLIHQKKIEPASVYKHISYAAPYLELIEEFTCIENIQFQQKFKPFLNQYTSNDILDLSGLSHSAKKQIKVFSSGMKQRLKLTLAILADCPFLFLDEPCSNLDAKAIDWYQQMLNEYAAEKLIIICSNHLHYEYQICKEQINTEEFK